MGIRQYPKNRYVSGTYKRECDISGFDHLRSELSKTWDNFVVSSRNYDEKSRKDIPKVMKKNTPMRFD